MNEELNDIIRDLLLYIKHDAYFVNKSLDYLYGKTKDIDSNNININDFIERIKILIDG